MKTLRRLRPVRTLAAAVALSALSLAIGFAPAAQAQVPHTVCASALELLTLEFDPALGLTQDPDTHFDQTNFKPNADCVGDFTGDVDIQNTHGTGSLSCTTSSDVSGTLNLHWSDTTNSHVDISGFGISGLPSSASKVVLLSGEVISGRFNGDDVTIEFTATVSDTTACVNKTLNSLQGNPVLEFTTP